MGFIILNKMKVKNSFFYIVLSWLCVSSGNASDINRSIPNIDQQKVIKVVGSNRPVVGLLAMLLDQITEPMLLNSSQSSSHHMMISPSQYELLTEADLFVWVGKDYEYSLSKAVDKIFKVDNSNSEGSSVKQIELQNTPTLLLLSKRKGGLFPGCSHEHGDEHEDHEHHHSNVDAHFFISIPHAKDCCVHLVSLMIKKWPHLDYQLKINLNRTLEKLDELDKQIRVILEPVRDMAALSDHDSLQYWEKSYGFDIRGVMSNDEGVAPSFSHVKNLNEELALNQSEKTIKSFFFAGFSDDPQISQPPSLMRKLCDPFQLPLYPFDYEGQNPSLKTIEKKDWYLTILTRLALDLVNGFMNPLKVEELK